MKKVWILLLALLMLTGCTGGPAAPTETTTSGETTVPHPSFYVSGSAVERGSGGKVRQFELDNTITGMTMLNGNLLLCLNSRTLYLLDPETLDVIRTRELEHELDWNDGSLVIGYDGIAFYDKSSHTYTVLDETLIITAAFPLNIETHIPPVISDDLTKIYYATEEGICVMHSSDGTSRRVREEGAAILSVDGLMFDDTILCYTRQVGDKAPEKCFVRIEDGSLLDTTTFREDLFTEGDSYVCILRLRHAMGETPWLITGTREGNQQRLASQYRWDSALLSGKNRAVLQTASSVGVTLYGYDLGTGKLLSTAILVDQSEAIAFSAADDNRIWLCDGVSNRFFCWDTTTDSLTDQKSEYVPYVTLESGTPDLSQASAREKLLEDRYSVTIELVPGENRTAGGDYSAFPDLRPEQYDDALAQLQRAMEILPENFLKKAGQTAASRRLTIRLVDDFDPLTGTSKATGSIDVSNNQVVLQVSMCPTLKEIFYHELFHVLDIQILNESDGMNHWEKLNPKKFEYVNSYADYESGALKDSPYLVWGENAFADDYAMISPREDRAQVFLYAVLENQEFRFTSPVMQDKLELICKMIHKCIGSFDAPIWEQYLEK